MRPAIATKISRSCHRGIEHTACAVPLRRRRVRPCHRTFVASAGAHTLPVNEVRISRDSLNCTRTLQGKLVDLVGPSFEQQEPLVVRGALEQTPATQLWSQKHYWNDISKETDPLVAVEIGGSYGSGSSERAEIPFSAYLQFLELFEERHGSKGSLPRDIDGSDSMIPSEELVYMAQNDLIPELYKDILVPEFCENDSKTIGLGRLYSVMMWLGPRGCVSPLHFDPLDNIFMEHKGRKRVLLFPSNGGTDIPWHYAGHEDQQSNTSPVDPEVLDWTQTTDASKNIREKYPLFFEYAPTRLECVLEPGDLLYIPSKWWHHVRSIDASISVNIWWR